MSNNTRRKQKRPKQIVFIYLIRGSVILILAAMITLMVCGCLYIYECFAKDDTVATFACDHNTDTDSSVTQYAPETDRESKFCVVIDAGHGGVDGGTVGGDVIEKDINLSVALKMKAILEENDVEVILTRSSDADVSLSERTTAANQANADFFISVHCNYYEGDSSIAGLECYYRSPEATESKAFAESIIKAAASSDDIIVRDAKTEGYYVLNHTQMPAVLVEMGFLSNYSECQKLASSEYQDILSEKLVEGILRELTDNKEV